MPTTKHRINITTTPASLIALRRAAQRDRMPIASKAAELIELALELEEDIALGALADLRMRKRKRFISHETAWKR
jgi:hypothetical protein